MDSACVVLGKGSREFGFAAKFVTRFLRERPQWLWICEGSNMGLVSIEAALDSVSRVCV
jgi:ammonia channel protein AmtB